MDKIGAYLRQLRLHFDSERILPDFLRHTNKLHHLALSSHALPLRKREIP